MLNVYEKDNYRELFEALFNEARERLPHLTLNHIAMKCGLQPSYLTNVVKHRSHFSLDQASDILTFLGYNSEEIDFVLLLIEFERSGSSIRKKGLKEKIQKARQVHLNSDKYIQTKKIDQGPLASFIDYYLDPFTPILHMYFGLENAIQTPAKIATLFKISEKRVRTILETLKKNNFIELKNGRYILSSKTIHLPKESPLTKPHQALMRTLAIEKILRLDSEEHYAFTATFNADEQTRTQIQIEFLKFISKAQALSTKAPSENILQLNFDLFPWIQ